MYFFFFLRHYVDIFWSPRTPQCQSHSIAYKVRDISCVLLNQPERISWVKQIKDIRGERAEGLVSFWSCLMMWNQWDLEVYIQGPTGLRNGSEMVSFQEQDKLISTENYQTCTAPVDPKDTSQAYKSKKQFLCLVKTGKKRETGRETQKEHESQGGPVIYYWLCFQSSTGSQKGETILYSQKSCGFKITSPSHTHTQWNVCCSQ